MKDPNPKSEIQTKVGGESDQAGPVAWSLFRPHIADRSPVSGVLPILAGLAFLVTAVSALGQDQEAEPDHPFRFGFSTALMPEVSENDSRAAMKVWGDTMIKSGAVRADPNVFICHDLETMLAALQNRSVDGVAVTTSELITLRERVQFNRYVFGVVDGSIPDEYVLLVRQQGGPTRIEDLQGRSLNLQRHSRTSLAMPWLDTFLVGKGLKPTREFFGQVTEETKLTKAVLPVFFRKTDACLVTRKGFKAMGELNPQVSRQLRVLASSPALVAAGFFFRTGFPQPLQDKCLAEFTRVHTTPAGQQILTVFQTERLEEHPASVLDSAVALLETHRRLCGGTNSPKAVAASVMLDATKGAAE
jgi:ABC-type phosphate/phosphonate transport system substrate-binding protein